MYKIGSLPHSIPIGYTGETNFRTIEIDMTAWMEKMPAGVPSIVHIRPGESKADAYVAVTEFDTETNVLTWNITAADIGTLEGEGEMQIWLEEPDEEDTDVISKRGKSVKVTTKVTDAANDPSSTVPSSQEAFLEQVTSLKTQTVTAKEAAEDAQDAAETAKAAAEQAATDAENVNLHPAYIDSTTKHWMVYDATQHQYVDTEIKAQGEDGQDGQDATPDLVCMPYEDLTFPVSKGTLCYHGSDLCKAKQDISTSEEWTAAHWDVTTVADELRLQMSGMQGKYDVFGDYSEKAICIPDTTDYPNEGTVKLYGSDMSFGTAELRSEPNFLKFDDSFGTLNGCQYKKHGSVFEINGTKDELSSVGYFILFSANVDIPSGTELNIYIKSNAPINGLTSDAFLVLKDANNAEQAVYIIPSASGTSYTRTLTTNKNMKKISLTLEIPKPATTFDNLKVWFGVFPSNVTTIDTNISVSEGETENYTNVSIGSWSAIDFGAYDGSVLYKVEDLKNYIDTRTPDVKMTYVTPEDFGAVGNGVVDDYQAIQDCIDYAFENNKAVRAYGIYAISDSIVIDGNNINVEINKITTTMNDYAVKLSGMRNTVKIKSIYNNEGNGGGILISPITSNFVECNTIDIDRIHVNNGNAIRMYALNNGVQSLIYNIIRVTELFSRNDDCIYCEGGFGENKFYGGKLATNTGWAIHFKNHAFTKMYGFSMENDCYAGILLEGSSLNMFIGFRFIELMLRKTDTTNKGTLIKFKGGSGHANNYMITSDVIYGECIDITEAYKIRDYKTYTISNNASHSVIESSAGIQSRKEYEYSGGMILNVMPKIGSKCFIKDERIVCVPEMTTAISIDDDIDMSAIPYEGQYTVINVKGNANIKLNPSYCSAGTNDFKVANKNGDTFAVTDCNDVLFISASGSGEYHFHCVADIDNVYRGILGNDVPGWWNGENDLWFVEHNGETIGEIHLQPFYTDPSDTVSLTGELVTSGTWSTSDSSVATVSNGTVTAVAEGKATITITDGNGKVERWVIDVSDDT